jgi:hypothetical protein
MASTVRLAVDKLPLVLQQLGHRDEDSERGFRITSLVLVMVK